MKVWKALSMIAIVLSWSATAVAQDPLKVSPANYKLVVENASVRILRVDVAVGAKTATHSHPDAMVIALGPSKIRFTMPDGKTQDSDMANESAIYTPAGTHTSANTGTTRADALVVEFKTPAPGKAMLPASREGMTIKSLAEGPRALAYRSTAAPTFVEAPGSKHDYDQIVIALGPAQMSLSLDGKPAKTSWVRGDVVFIGRGTPHEAKNTSGKPMDFLIVAIK